MSQGGYTQEQRAALNEILRLVEQDYPPEEFAFGEISSLQEEYTWDELKTILEYIDHAEENKNKLFLAPVAYMNLRLATYKQIFDKIKHVRIQENCPKCEKEGRKGVLIFVSPQYCKYTLLDGKVKYAKSELDLPRCPNAVESYYKVETMPIFVSLSVLFPEMGEDGREGKYYAMCTECGHLMVTDNE